jgi:hypothetical protein
MVYIGVELVKLRIVARAGVISTPSGRLPVTYSDEE